VDDESTERERPEVSAVRPPAPVTAGSRGIRVLMGLLVITGGVLATYAGRLDFRTALLAGGNGPLLPLLFLGPAIAALGLGMASASAARARYPERALADGLAFGGLLWVGTGAFFTIMIVTACGGIPMVLVGGVAIGQALRIRRALVAGDG